MRAWSSRVKISTVVCIQWRSVVWCMPDKVERRLVLWCMPDQVERTCLLRWETVHNSLQLLSLHWHVLDSSDEQASFIAPLEIGLKCSLQLFCETKVVVVFLVFMLWLPVPPVHHWKKGKDSHNYVYYLLGWYCRSCGHKVLQLSI